MRIEGWGGGGVFKEGTGKDQMTLNPAFLGEERGYFYCTFCT